VKVYDANGVPGRKESVFSRKYYGVSSACPVEDEGRLKDPELRENFIERSLYTEDAGVPQDRPFGKGLVSFHTDHKCFCFRTAHGTIHTSAASWLRRKTETF